MPHSTPNILWLMTDEQRPDSIRAYGNSKMKTPYLDELAAHGTLFKNAVCQAPVCVPSRASMLTGKYCRELGIYRNRQQVAEYHVTFPEIFESLGYKTASIGKYHARLTKYPFMHKGGLVTVPGVGCCDLDPKYSMEEYKVVRYPVKDNVFNWLFGGTQPGPIEGTSEWINASEAISYIENTSDPFFLRVSFNHPHTPVLAVPPFDTLFEGTEFYMTELSEEEEKTYPRFMKEVHRKHASAEHFTKEQILKMRATYCGVVTSVDAQIGRIIDALKKKGVYENTIIVFNADHGTSICDHGILQKQTFYEEVVRVPMIMSWPGHLPEEKIIDEQVENIDFLPTVMDLAGYPDHIPTVPGKSILPFLNGKTQSHRSHVFSEVCLEWEPKYRDKRMIMVRTPEWKLGYFTDEYKDGADNDGILFNLKEDPHEITNLFKDPSKLPVIHELMTAAKEMLPETK